MSDTIAPVHHHTLDEYKGGSKPTWCPGCGDFGVLNALYNALKEEGRDPKDIISVAGIGCSSRLPFFMSTYGFHSLHGRAMPVATGLRIARPDLLTVVFGGDGDGFAIGGGHFLHAARRNLDICYVVMDNAVYGLTKGQAAPTAALGYAPRIMPPTVDRPLNPTVLAIASGATFVARGFSGKPKELAQMVLQGLRHRGFALIDAYSPCPTFNKINTFKAYREEIAEVPADHDPTDKMAALQIAASQVPSYVGVLYREETSTFEDNVLGQIKGTEDDAPALIESIFDRYA